MDFNGQTDRNVDIVFCIDGTGSMSGVIDTIKSHARRFQQDLTEALIDAKSNITSLRVRLITFRDYGTDSDAMEQTRFFELPADQAEFESALAKIDAHGGGDAPENGFEALYYAMKSEFVTGPKDRQIIVLFTDADALDLGARRDAPSYPADMVDREGLDTMWVCKDSQDGYLRERLKRLVVFAPVGTKYANLVWNRYQYTPVESGEGLKEIDFAEIIKSIVKSATAV